MAGVRMLWCWRCKAEMPMLDEEEFESVKVLYSSAMRATKEFRQDHTDSLASAPIHEHFRHVRKRYEELTGIKDCH